MTGELEPSPRWHYPAWAAGWLLVVLVSAGQWFAYDASRGDASPFSYYLWWAAYMWAALTPAAAWLAWRRPIRSSNLLRSLPLHLGASLTLTVVQLSVESYLGWRRHQHLLAAAALRHYFSQHAQISLSAYWLIVAAVMYVRTREDANEAAVRAAVLKTQLSDARLEVLRRQLQPHFLFNTLQAAIELVHADPDGAEDILLRLSELLRILLEEVHSDEIALGRELELLGHYIAIQERRFHDRLDFDVRVDPALYDCGVPSLLLQPLVENAVRHGIGEHRRRDTIVVAACRRDQVLNLTITNGSGTLVERRDGTRGLGLAATRERLDHLYGAGSWSLELTPLDPGGVCVSVSIPLRRLETTTDVLATAGSS